MNLAGAGDPRSDQTVAVEVTGHQLVQAGDIFPGGEVGGVVDLAGAGETGQISFAICRRSRRPPDGRACRGYFPGGEVGGVVDLAGAGETGDLRRLAARWSTCRGCWVIGWCSESCDICIQMMNYYHPIQGPATIVSARRKQMRGDSGQQGTQDYNGWIHNHGYQQQSAATTQRVRAACIHGAAIIFQPSTNNALKSVHVPPLLVLYSHDTSIPMLDQQDLNPRRMTEMEWAPTGTVNGIFHGECGSRDLLISSFQNEKVPDVAGIQAHTNVVSRQEICAPFSTPVSASSKGCEATCCPEGHRGASGLNPAIRFLVPFPRHRQRFHLRAIAAGNARHVPTRLRQACCKASYRSA